MRPELHQISCSLVSEAAVLVKHTPVQGIFIHSDVTVVDAQTHNLITRSIAHVKVEVEVIRDSFRSGDFQSLELFPDHSSDCGNIDHNSFNNVHVFVQVFGIVNLLQLHNQIISRRKALVSSIVLVCVVCVLVSVARWLNAIILIVARCAQSMNP